MTTECSICCEVFNKTSHKKLDCRFCDLTFCANCEKRHLLENVTDPACMKCSKGFTREHLIEMLPKKFLDTDYKKHRESILYEREKCLLPGTQARIENRKEIASLEKQLIAVRQRLMTLKYGGEAVADRREFIRKCPGANCNGFLNRNYNCGLCDVSVCKDCHEIKEKDEEGVEKEHTCNLDNVETVRLLAKDSKPCPACGVVIFKISGCSQMWCTSCHTAFDWKSGRIEKGIIHNPHYYEYQRANNGGVAPRVPGDIPPCDANGQVNINDAIRSWGGLTSQKQSQLVEIHRMINHVRDTRQFAAGDLTMQNEDVRIMFLENTIDEDRFKWMLQKREKRNAVKREIRQVLEMFTACSTDILRKTVVDQPTTLLRRNICVDIAVVDDAIEELQGLITYTNETLGKISEVYGATTPKFCLTDTKLLFETQKSVKKRSHSDRI